MQLHKKDSGTPFLTAIDAHMVPFVPSSPQTDYHIGQWTLPTSKGVKLNPGTGSMFLSESVYTQYRRCDLHMQVIPAQGSSGVGENIGDPDVGTGHQLFAPKGFGSPGPPRPLQCFLGGSKVSFRPRTAHYVKLSVD
jgi:hypothetical protein